MKIAICDDETVFSETLSKQITNCAFKDFSDFEIKIFNSVEALQSDLEHFDIVFLDICFNGNDVGIEWAKQLNVCGHNPLIVICSSLKSQIIKGYQANAVRFLVKPVKTEDLFEALNACMKKLSANNRQIIVKSDFDDLVVNMSQILFVESGLRHRTIFSENGTKVETNETLQSLYSKLDKQQFKYSHKSYIVQLSKVKRIERTKLTMINGLEVPLSRNLVTEFRKNIMTFIGEKL